MWFHGKLTFMTKKFFLVINNSSSKAFLSVLFRVHLTSLYIFGTKLNRDNENI